MWQIRANSSHVWQIRSNVKVKRICHKCEKSSSLSRATPQNINLGVRMGRSPLAADSMVTNGYRQRSREPKCQIHHLTRIQLDTEASLTGKFHSLLRRCDNKKNQRWLTAAMFFDKSDSGLGSCTTRHWGEHSDQYLKKSDQWSWRRCDNQPVNGKFHFVRAGNQTAKLEFFLYLHN